MPISAASWKTRQRDDETSRRHQHHYGYGDGPAIIDGVHLTVEPGKVHCIIGPNGAGKSTLLKAICGMLSIRKGDVVFKGERLNGLRPDQILRKGICFAAGARAVCKDDRAREPAHGRLHHR